MIHSYFPDVDKYKHILCQMCHMLNKSHTLSLVDRDTYKLLC